MSAVTIYQNRLKAVRMQTAKLAMAEWDRLPNLERPMAEPFARKAMKIVTAGQMLAARTTNGHISRQANIAPVRLTPAQVTGMAARNVDPIEEYQRPFHATWAALADGQDFAAARLRGRDALKILAVTDVWLAMRATTEVIDQATPKITSWVRVADGAACPDCSAADGMETSAAGDLAGHPNCGCTSEPRMSEDPPSDAADPSAIDVQHHAELGPVLVAA